MQTIRLSRSALKPIWGSLLFLSLSQSLLAVSVTLDGAGTGQTFRGVGGVSAGASSRTILDYPSQQKSDILDFLFKPNFGAALHHLKVEIGGDENSTDGTEPSHERSNGSVNCNRGWEWYLMQQAVARNASITLDSLMWGTAGYNSTFYSASNITYVEDFLTCAAGKSLTMAYTGAWNEPTSNNPTWMKLLHTTLVADGFTTVKLSIDDLAGGNEFALANTYNSDSALQAAAPVLNVHYPNYSTSCTTSDPNYSVDATIARTSHSAELWDSEDGFWFYHSNSGQANWVGAQDTAHFLNCNYLAQKIVKTELWALYSGYYGILPLAGAGQLQASEPWSGHYTVSPTIWAIAHTTQFAQPGWQYVDSSSGNLSTGTYVTLKSGTDYSVIIETRGESGDTTFNFTIAGGLSTGTVHVWKSDTTTQFIQQSDIVPSGGTFSLTAAKDSIYTLTTTTGQAKGSATIPAATAFPFPYLDSFEAYNSGSLGKYWSDQAGAFEAAACTGSHAGTCYRQVLATAPIYWPTNANWTHPYTIVGDTSWTDYLVKSDVMLEAAGTVNITGRLASVSQSGNINGYILQVDDTGVWSVTTGYAIGSMRGAIAGCSGTLGGGFGTNTWHTLQLKFTGTTIAAAIDGTQLCSVTDSTYSAGMVGLGTQGYTSAQYDTFGVCSTSGCPTFTGSNRGGSATFGGSRQ